MYIILLQLAHKIKNAFLVICTTERCIYHKWKIITRNRGIYHL